MPLTCKSRQIEHPDLIDFVDFASGSFDFLKYSISVIDHDEKKSNSPDIIEKISKRPFKHRKTYFRRDPKTSFWWIDYVIDAGNTWRDPAHRDRKLFQKRFSHNFDSVKEIVAKIQEEGHYFWRNKIDNKGRLSSPIELLVLGSLRLLTRNVTLDDLSEQIFISSEVHRCWYSTVVFPLCVRLPT